MCVCVSQVWGWVGVGTWGKGGGGNGKVRQGLARQGRGKVCGGKGRAMAVYVGELLGKGCGSCILKAWW